MNRLHRWLCRSDRWRNTIRERLPWVIGDTSLGPNVLEIGPGPGLTTDLLRTSVPRLTALEIDSKLAGSLSARLEGSNVRVVKGDATVMPFRDSEFSGTVSFTMLHHVPSPELQDRVLREVLRVLRPGGFFLGSDSLQSWWMKIIHIGDTSVREVMVPRLDINAVPVTAAALGTDLVLTTLDGDEKLDIRAGTQTGARLTLRGRGVPRLRSSTRGDLYVHVEVGP